MYAEDIKVVQKCKKCIKGTISEFSYTSKNFNINQLIYKQL